MHEFEEFVSQDMGFSIPRTGVYDDQGFDDNFCLNDAFDEIRLYLEEAGYPVVQQRECCEYEE